MTPDAGQPELAVVIPAWNQREYLDLLLPALRETLDGKVLPGAHAHEHITHDTQASLRERLRRHGYAIQGRRYVGFCERIFQAQKRIAESSRGAEFQP